MDNLISSMPIIAIGEQKRKLLSHFSHSATVLKKENKYV